ncbi:MAG TPA: DUF433 domain-containing protein [Thermoanaerobaculia bacterium]|nr:DUF433 domain-containing protein [Thermoanaerobaculia bacterium]
MILADPRFPQITYRKGAAGAPVAMLRGSGTRVRTLWAARTSWNWSPQEIAREYGLRPEQVEEALSFGNVHQTEIEADLALEEELARRAPVLFPGKYCRV